MNNQHYWILFLWIVYCALHSILAAQSFKRQAQKWMGSSFRFYRLWYVLFVSVSLAAIIIYQLSVSSPRLFTTNAFTITAGAALCIAGILVMAICIRKYFMHLSGVKSLYLNDSEAANQLQITGIHRYVRHPLYTGTFAAVWGGWLLLPSLSFLLANLVITVYTLMAITWEERKLVKEFGNDYQQYRQKVPKLLPLPSKVFRFGR